MIIAHLPWKSAVQGGTQKICNNIAFSKGGPPFPIANALRSVLAHPKKLTPHICGQFFFDPNIFDPTKCWPAPKEFGFCFKVLTWPKINPQFCFAFFIVLDFLGLCPWDNFRISAPDLAWMPGIHTFCINIFKKALVKTPRHQLLHWFTPTTFETFV